MSAAPKLEPAPAPVLLAIVQAKEPPHVELYRVWRVEAGGSLDGEALFPGIWSWGQRGAPVATPQKLQALEGFAEFVGEVDGVKRYRQ